jgi:hypothetical protein
VERPLETGWLPDTPVEDTVIRRFVFNQSDVNAEQAIAFGGRATRDDDVAMADAGVPIPYFNQAVLLRPLAYPNDPVLARIDDFYAAGAGHARTVLSLWPTPDLRPRGWTLVGHPAFVVRSPHPPTPRAAPGVVVEEVRDPDRLAVAERIAIEGYPLDEARGFPPGAVLPPAVLSTGVLYRLGCVDGAAVAAAARYVGRGIVNLCFAATLPAARRRGVWEALVWARVMDGDGLPAVAYTSDYSRPGFERMGFVPVTRGTLWAKAG